MKVGTAAPRSSFGIPPEFHPDNIAKNQVAPAPTAPPPQVDTGFSNQSEDEEGPVLTDKAKGAIDFLKSELGVEMSGDDWSSLFYKGFVEKTIVVAQVPDPATKTYADFSMTLRTLTADETDEADELFAAEIRDLDVTREGITNRRQMWNFTYAVQKINGHDLCKPVKDADGKVDRKALAKAKRKILTGMAPLILKQATIKYSRFVELLDSLVSEPGQAFFD